MLLLIQRRHLRVLVVDHLVRKTVLVLTLQRAAHVLGLARVLLGPRLRQMLHLLLGLGRCTELLVLDRAVEEVVVQAIS